MQFTLLGFPVRVEPWFWLTAFLLGGGLRPEAFTSAGLANIGIWMILAFFSVLAHELGHALTGRRFGSDPVIVLHGFFGVAIMDTSPFTRWQYFAMVAAGPAFSFGLGVSAIAVLMYVPGLNEDWAGTVQQLAVINVSWTILNLLPVRPLDGGEMLRVLLGENRFGATCIIGTVVGTAVAVLSLMVGQVFLTLMMALFAFENWRAMRR